MPARGAAAGERAPGGALLALVDSTQLAIACNGVSSTSVPMVYTSDDGGANWAQLPA